MEKWFGLDIGRSNSYIGVWKDEKVEILDLQPKKGGTRAIPSYIAITHEGQVLIGEDAR